VEGCVPGVGGGIDVAAVLQQEVHQDEVFGLHRIMNRGSSTAGVLKIYGKGVKYTVKDVKYTVKSVKYMVKMSNTW